MPELPEVETIRRSLQGKVIGKQILKTEVCLPRQVKWPSLPAFMARTAGRTIVRFDRSGKYLLLILDNGNELIVHLRMTGRLIYGTTRSEVTDAYARIIFHLAGGAVLVYADTRTLGAVYALKPGERWRIQGLAEMGPEPLSAAFTPAYLCSVLAKRRIKVKSFLLNQKFIGGLGNIYADEALFLAGIHPCRMAYFLCEAEIERLFTAINTVIRAGLEDGGTTFRDYRDGEGKKGHHQEKLNVYHRDGKPCTVCGTAIARIVVGGRGTHFCPQCQPEG